MERTLGIRRSLAAVLTKAIFGSALFASIVACSSISVDVPGPMIESPEIARHIELGFSVEPASRYSYTSDASARPPNLSNPEADSTTMVAGRFGWAVIDWLEVGARLLSGGAGGLLPGGLALTTKAQILGKTAEPGMSLAVYGGSYFVSTSARGDQRGVFGPGGYNWRAEANANTLTGGVSIGYRSDLALVYAAISYANQRVTGSIHHDTSSDLSSPAADYTLDTINAYSRAYALGLQYGKTAILQADARLIESDWPGYTVAARGGGARSEFRGAVALIFH